MLKTVIDVVEEERIRQDEKWGRQDHSPFHWLAILMEEVGEASKAAVEAFPHKNPISEGEKKQYLLDYGNELIQVAAVAVAAIESLHRNEVPL